MRLQVDADRSHVADDLLFRFFESKVKDPLTVLACRTRQRGGEAAFPHAGRTRHQNRAATIVAANAQHRVEVRHAGRDHLARDLVLQRHRGDRQHRKSLLVDDERILVGAVAAAAILHDPHAARGDLIHHAMVEQDNAVGDVFLETETGERVLAAFAGDNRGYAERFQELKQPPDLSAQKRRVRKS